MKKHTLYNIYKRHFNGNKTKIKYTDFLGANIFLVMEDEEDYWWMLGFDNKTEEEGWFVENALRTNVVWNIFSFIGNNFKKAKGVFNAKCYKKKNKSNKRGHKRN